MINTYNNRILSYNNRIFDTNMVPDVNVLAFLSATTITAGTQVQAVNYLVENLKYNGLWNKLTCIYPFVGGNATAHSYNLKNPAQFQITFVNSPTHNTNGVTTNGTNNYMNTGYIPGSNITTNSESMGLYSRTAAGSGVAGTAIDMGVVGTGGRTLMSIRAATGGDIGIDQMNDSTTSNFNHACTDGRGIHILSRTTSTLLERSQNGVLIASSTGANGGVSPTGQNIFIGSRNVTGVAQGFCARNYAFAFMGQGLTLYETTLLYSIVQNYQTILGRQV